MSAGIEALTRRFFARVRLGPGQRPDYQVLHKLFIKDGGSAVGACKKSASRRIPQ